jgi:hypothetical protein
MVKTQFMYILAYKLKYHIHRRAGRADQFFLPKILTGSVSQDELNDAEKAFNDQKWLQFLEIDDYKIDFRVRAEKDGVSADLTRQG